MGYVFDFKDAQRFEAWLREPQRRSEVERENRLMMDMLAPQRGESVLEIGCGTGVSLQGLCDHGLNVTGIDPSPYMLDLALARMGNRVELYRGVAEDLPFDDNSFNHALFMTTLEFVEDPRGSLEEACRVAKDRVFVGVLNRYAIHGIQRRVAGLFSPTIYNRARFFGIWELKRLIRSVTGEAPLTWRTVNQLPAGCGSIGDNIEQAWFMQRCPFGAFVGMLVTLVPVLRTRPLAIRYSTKHTRHTGMVTG
jgi:SAM-dependent methyltransferase